MHAFSIVRRCVAVTHVTHTPYILSRKFPATGGLIGMCVTASLLHKKTDL